MSLHKVIVLAVLEMDLDDRATSPDDCPTVQALAADVVENLPRNPYLPFSNGQAICVTTVPYGYGDDEFEQHVEVTQNLVTAMAQFMEEVQA